MISITLYTLGYYKNPKYTIPAYQIVYLRNLLRLFDFEQSRNFMEAKEFIRLMYT